MQLFPCEVVYALIPALQQCYIWPLQLVVMFNKDYLARYCIYKLQEPL